MQQNFIIIMPIIQLIDISYYCNYWYWNLCISTFIFSGIISVRETAAALSITIVPSLPNSHGL